MCQDPSTPDTGASPASAVSEPIVIEYTPRSAPRRRVRYEPRGGSAADRWWRIEAEWTGCHWRTLGREPVREPVCHSLTPPEDDE